MKKTPLTLALLGSLSSVSLAQTVTHTFVPNTPAQAAQVNQNFTDVLNLISTQNTLITDLQNQVAELQQKLQYVSTDSNTSTMVFEGVNVQIRNGLGATNGNATFPPANKGPTNGLGNLIIGYNEASIRAICSDGNINIDASNPAQAQSNCEAGGGTWGPNQRNGSHNVIIGSRHNYTSHGALITGHDNSVNNRWASVTGGTANLASGGFSSIAAGLNNMASGPASYIAAGTDNLASGSSAAILGGRDNQASGTNSTVSAGRDNRAFGTQSSVSGGFDNLASATSSSVGGGEANIASGIQSSISGGLSNQTTGNNSHVSGGRDNTASGSQSSVSGGRNNQAQGNNSAVSGGGENRAQGSISAVSGGINRSVNGAGDWAAGSLFEPN